MLRTPVYTLSAIDLTSLCAQYLKVRFQFELNERSSQLIGITTELLPAPKILPIKLMAEIHCIAKTLADAFLNHGKHILYITHFSYQ